MKKIVSFVLVVTLVMSFVTFAYADDFKVTHTSIKSKDDIKDINVLLPIFGGFNGADQVNREVLNIVIDAIGDANATAKSMLPLKKELIEKGEPAASMVVSLDMTYDYVKLDEILSVQLNIYSYSGGAHGHSQTLSITSNTSTGQIYEFKDIFNEDVDYNQVITELILKEIGKETGTYFPNYEETILNKNGNYEFYIDGNKLVVYFGLYDIAPYAAGIRYFMVDSEDIKGILKDEVYNSIKDGNERGSINFNGKDMNRDKGIIENNNISLIPLRVIAEALGYEVDWNKEDGAIVAGKPVSVESLIVRDGTTYVPLSYFRYNLNENVSLGVIGNDRMILRAYGKDSANINNSSLIKGYEKPQTIEEAINMYAEAVKMRNGMVEYALLDDNLREEKYEEFNSLGFVTGTSSPWIDSYEIMQLEESLYQIEFTYRTSVPTDIFTTDVNVRLVEDGQYIRITSIE